MSPAGRRSPAQQRNLFLSRPRAVRPASTQGAADELAQRRATIEAASDLVGRLLDRPGGLFAGDDVRRASPSSGAAGRSISSAPTYRPAASIARAAGVYSQFEVQRGLGINQMIRWFEETSDGWRAIEALRKPRPLPGPQPARTPPHPGGFDIILCRNVLLYLSPEKKTLAFERIAGAMADDGWLMLGAGETVIGQTVQAWRRPRMRAASIGLSDDARPRRETRRTGSAEQQSGVDPTPVAVRQLAR